MNMSFHNHAFFCCIFSFIQGLVIADTISSKTLEDMDQAITNFKSGSVSPAIDLSDVEKEGSQKEVVE